MAPTLKVARKTRPKHAGSGRMIKNRKFMQTLSKETYEMLEATSKDGGITVQELLRAKIIPEWLRSHRKEYE